MSISSSIAIAGFFILCLVYAYEIGRHGLRAVLKATYRGLFVE